MARKTLLVSNTHVDHDVVLEKPRRKARRRLPVPDVFDERPKYWFTMPVHGIEWHFGFVSTEQMSKLSPEWQAWAITIAESFWVAFDETLMVLEKRDVLRRTFVHEVVHVAFADPTVAKCLFGRLSDQGASDREEALCEYLAQRLADSLFSGGILRLPRLPRRGGK